jgi:anaerobic dimethyl sulfoxide reductase subunit C (anchor subunit)
MTEWPLVLFTVAIQLACGLALTTTLCDRSTQRLAEAHMRPLGMAIFPVAAAGMLLSLLHVGRPLLAFRSLYNLRNSRLSLEILLTVLFALAAFVYSRAWWKNISRNRLACGEVASVLGVAAVVSSAAVYLVPVQPAWNSGWVPVSFLGTTLLLGGFAAIAFADLPADRILRRGFLAGTASGGVLLLISATWMVLHVARPSADDFVAAQLERALHVVAAHHSVWLGIFLFLAAVVPIAFAIRMWPSPERGVPRLELRIVFGCVLLGALVGRALMYALGTPYPF